jgi:hypothetical protein
VIDLDHNDVKLARYTVRRARKDHRCSACYGAIQAGEQYRRIASVTREGWDTCLQCRVCAEIFDRLLDLARPGEGVAFALDCGEEYEDPPPDLAALAFALPQDLAPLEVKP